MSSSRDHDTDVDADVDADNGQLRRELAFSAQLAVGLLSGICIAVLAVAWSMNGLRDILNVPELASVPINDPPPNIPGPTITYWLAWAIPSLVVYSLGAILFWRWKPLRWLIVSFMIGFVAVSLLCIPLIIYIDVTGF
ncbi:MULTISPECIES: hypothetical protein [Actinomycetes]|uniref:hypothetical protein n=1 Tax=Actinomycetes TaxID=1760 RepID=UPI0004BF1984|nr:MULTISPECIES: hypothetical protein [Actinomycetes]MCK0515916.1 hypothetical protein [Williamsia sp. DF01-3]